ncbi:MAG: hypothetical protein U9N39_08810 [Campylobacterota bacterium]|nr:hypothetical protein [Campylobacterota bacterium]
MPLHALSHYSYDFRDINATVNFTINLDAKSNKLPFNIFDQEWKEVPVAQKSNRAFGQVYTDVYVDYEGLKIGVFGEKIAEVEINDGFIDLWYSAQKDFLQLLVSKDIYKTIEPNSIKGEANYCNPYGLYLQKVFALNSSNFLSVKLKLNYADEMQYIKVNGYTNSEKFSGSLDYVYAQENYISNTNNKRQGPMAIGYGVDIEYIYNRDKLYVYLGAYNLASSMYWSNVTHMHYDFDSEVIYKGDDGYNHYKPFGVGNYKYNQSFRQKLPVYYKASLNYEFYDSFALGNNFKLYNQMYSNEPHVNFKIYNGRYKLGYQIEDNIFLFGTYFRNVNFEVANKFGLEDNVLQANIKLSF